MPAIPSKPSFTDAGVTEGDFKTALVGLHDYLTTLLGSDGSRSAALQGLGALAGAGVLVRSTAYTLVAADRGRIVSCTGTWSLGLTSAATLGAGFAFLVANMGAGVITIDPAGTETINGAETYTVGAGATVLVMAVAAGAWVVAGVALSDAIDSDSSSTAASSKAVKDAASLWKNVGHNNIGSYVFAGRTSLGALYAGSLVSGSTLRPMGMGVGSGASVDTGLAGTWLCLGATNRQNSTSTLVGTLWQRIS